MATEQFPAVVMAGDQGAAKAVHGESKAYLEIGGRALVAHVVAALQGVPEVSSVWVIGDRERLGEALAPLDAVTAIRKPLHRVSQHRNLIENAWQSYRRLLPGADTGGRDPEHVGVGAGAAIVSIYLERRPRWPTPLQYLGLQRSRSTRW